MADDNRDRPGLRLRIFGILARNCTAPDLDASPLPPAHVTADLGCRVLIDDVDPGEPERGVLRGAAPGRSPGCEWRWWAERPGQAVHRPRCPPEIEQTTVTGRAALPRATWSSEVAAQIARPDPISGLRPVTWHRTGGRDSVKRRFD